jgi:hypothetical protein
MAQQSKISPSAWSQGFSGFSMRGCAVRERGFFYFVLEELPAHHKARQAAGDTRPTMAHLAVYYEPDTQEAWSFDELFGFPNPKLAVLRVPKPHCVVTGGQSGVYAAGSDYDGIEPPAPALVRRVRGVAGVGFAVAGERRVFQRSAPKQWDLLGGPMTLSSNQSTESVGFRDVSGFSENDIYSVGGQGDVWHWNGTEWRRCDFPSNYFLETVLCAGDGKVYITGQAGSIFVGRDDKWKLLESDALSGYYNDTVWYDDKVWLSHDSGLYVLNHQGTAESADLPPQIHVTTGYLSVGDGLMLSAGIGGASVYDGKKWEILVNHFEMQKLAGGGKGKT